MGTRIELQTLLQTITSNVYFQPPSNFNMSYPAIVYSRKTIETLKANDKKYKMDRSYNVTVIDRNPDSPIVDKLLELDYCEFDRQFITDGLNHTSLVIYY